MQIRVLMIFFKAYEPDSSSFKGITLIKSTDADKQEFLALRHSYLDSLIAHLEGRLINNTTIVRKFYAFSLLEPSMAISLSTEEKSKLLTMLESHFQISADCAADSVSRPEGNLVSEAPPILC